MMASFCQRTIFVRVSSDQCLHVYKEGGGGGEGGEGGFKFQSLACLMACKMSCTSYQTHCIRLPQQSKDQGL